MRKSVAPSKITSGTQTPHREDTSLESDLTSPLFSAQLLERLRLVDEEGEKKHGFAKNRLVHSIEVLGEDRRKTSELAREQALGTLLRELASKYTPAVMNYELFAAIMQAFYSARTPIEATTALQLITVAITLVEGTEDPRADDCFDLVKQLRESLPRRLTECADVEVKAAMTTAYSVLTYFLNAGGGGFGMEEVVGKLMEISEEISDPKDAPISTAALGGAALVTTLTTRGSIDEIVSDWLFSLTPMLEVSQLGPKLATVKLVAVFFELASASTLRSGDNREASIDIVDTLEAISQESTARAGKKNKKTQNLLVKSVLALCKHKLSGDENTIDEDKSALPESLSQYHKNTLSKSLGVRTWASLVVVEHLGWVFGPGLHSQLANNEFIRSLLKTEEVKVDSSASATDEYEGSEPTFREKPSAKADAAKRSKELRKLQLLKSESQSFAG